MPLYDYLTPKLDSTCKFNHRQSFLYKGRLTVWTIRKFWIGSSLRIESRIGSSIRNRIESQSFAGPYVIVTSQQWDVAYCYRRSSVVCLSVGRSRKWMNQSWRHSGCWLGRTQGTMGSRSPCKGTVLRGKVAAHCTHTGPAAVTYATAPIPLSAANTLECHIKFAPIHLPCSLSSDFFDHCYYPALTSVILDSFAHLLLCQLAGQKINMHDKL